MKECKKCGQLKPLGEFIKNTQCKDGFAGTCKTCQNGYSKKWKTKSSKSLAE